MDQAKHGTSKGLRSVDKHITRGAGGGAVRKAGSATGRAKRAVGGAVANNISEGKRDLSKKVAQGGKDTGKRTIKDAKAGTDYATRNLHQSPVDWAEAGLERYRENPVVDTTNEIEARQQELSDWRDKSSNNGQSK